MIPEAFKSITTFIFDIDGVLTDGMILLLENGLQARSMSIKDGYALRLAVEKRYRIMVVSGAGASPAVARLNKLGINDVHILVSDKKKLVEMYISANKLKKEDVL